MRKEDLEKSLPHLRSVVLVTAERFFGKESDEAQDVAQEVMLRLWQRSEALDSTKIDALAHAITRNLCVSIYRRQNSCVVNVEQMPEAKHSVTPLEHATDKDNQHLLSLAMEKLSKPQNKTPNLTSRRSLCEARSN